MRRKRLVGAVLLVLFHRGLRSLAQLAACHNRTSADGFNAYYVHAGPSVHEPLSSGGRPRICLRFRGLLRPKPQTKHPDPEPPAPQVPVPQGPALQVPAPQIATARQPPGR